MRHNNSVSLSQIIRIALLLLTMALAAACSTNECKESCEEDGDCGSGLRCYDTTSSGKICLPKSCGGCFDTGNTCTYTSDYDEDRVPAMKCEFSHCS